MPRPRQCRTCNLFRPLSQFSKDLAQKDGLRPYCKPCANAARRAWYAANAERERTKQRVAYALLRKETLDAYGGKCACCDELDQRFLAIDHIDGNGAEHRRALWPNAANGAGKKFYLWLRKNGFPLGFQVLCWNCNLGKHFHGVCPHKL